MTTDRARGLFRPPKWLLFLMMPASIFYLFIVPPIVAATDPDTPGALAGIAFGTFLYVQMWFLAGTWLYESVCGLYGLRHRTPKVFVRMVGEQPSPSPQSAAVVGLISYALAIYGFAIAYEFISHQSPKAFDPARALSFLDSLYFSTVTAMTVGYGDISPVSAIPRMVVTAQLWLNLAYVVLIFSLVASVLQVKSRASESP